MFNKRLLIILTAIISIIGIIAYIWWFNSFRVTFIDPSPIPLGTRQTTFYFSKSINRTYDTKNITIDPATPGKFTVGENSISFRADNDLQKGNLRFTFKDLSIQNGPTATLSTIVSVEYVPYNELSKNEQKRQLDQSDSNQSEFPITNGYVPHVSAAWGIEYLLPVDSGNDKLTLNVKIYADRGTNEPIVDYHARLDGIHQEVVDYIKAGGFKLEDYYINYEDPYLSKYDQRAPDNL